MHVTKTGQSCDGRFCLECGKCERCSTKAKTAVAVLGRSHTPHVYERVTHKSQAVKAVDCDNPQAVKKPRAKRAKTGATV